MLMTNCSYSYKNELNSLIEEIKEEFKITSKPASYFLGLKTEREENGSIKISQYIHNTLTVTVTKSY